jgi:plasmid maintenance system antidote protein VapI
MPSRIRKSGKALFDELKNDEEFILEELKLLILEDILKAMDLTHVDRAALARKLNTSRAYVTKLFNTNVNFTLKTIVRIAKAIGLKVRIHLVKEKQQEQWFEISKGTARELHHITPAGFKETRLRLTKEGTSERSSLVA